MGTQLIDPLTSSTGAPSRGRLARWVWRLAVAAVVVTGAIGLFFTSAMNPSGGPYAEDRNYPFGDPIQTWQTTVGFDWIAYAILFGAALVAARRLRSRRLFAVIAFSFGLLWLPHVLIAASILANGG